MVELKIRKFGNSLGVVLPKEVIDRLQTGRRGAAFSDRVGRWRLPAHALRSRIREEDGEGGRNHGPLSQHAARAFQVSSEVKWN